MFGLLACSSGWEQIKDTEDVDQIRRFIAENPHDSNKGEARLRIIQLDYRAAVRANTRYAYHSFLERHPESALALNVRKRMDELDYKEAEELGTVDALQVYLRRNPKGRYLEQVNAALDALRCRKGRALTSIDKLQGLMRSHPDLSCAAELKLNLRKMQFDGIKARPDLENMLAFLRLHRGDEGPEVREVEQLLLSKQVGALLNGARFSRAEALVRSRSTADGMAPLLARVAQAKREFAEAKQRPGRKRAQLSKAIALLAAERKPLPAAQSLPRDPRLRWLLADELGQRISEESADLLLHMALDPYLEVRRRAWRSLRQLAAELDPLRLRIWLDGWERRLETVGQAGPLLAKRALVAGLRGDIPMAIHLVEQLNLTSEQVDLFALALSVEWQLERGLSDDAAASAKRFSELAHKFCQQRQNAWREDPALKKGGEAWLILRQLHGLLELWSEVSRHFAPGKAERHVRLLGAWWERLEKLRKAHARWLKDEEARWAASQEPYIPSARGAGARSGPSEQSQGTRALLRLALSADATRRPLASWVARCHYDGSIRAVASSLQLLARLAGSLQSCPAVLGLGPWSP